MTSFRQPFRSIAFTMPISASDRLRFLAIGRVGGDAVSPGDYAAFAGADLERDDVAVVDRELGRPGKQRQLRIMARCSERAEKARTERRARQQRVPCRRVRMRGRISPQL